MRFYYMMSTMIINKAEAKGKLTEEERRRLCESIEAEEDLDRVPKNEDTVVEELKKEVRKLKIENNRSDNKTSETSIHYGEDRSWWESWRKFKNNPKFKDYKRSESVPGFWRSKSGNYRRAPSRTPSRHDSRDSSSSRSKRNESEKRGEHEKANTEKMGTQFQTQLKELTEALVKNKNVSFFINELEDKNDKKLDGREAEEIDVS